MNNPIEDIRALSDTFFQESTDLRKRITEDTRFAHYTAAETAMRIIKGEGSDRALWLRNATEMNDFSEIEYGQSCLTKMLKDAETSTRLQKAGEAVGLNIIDDVILPMGLERERIKRETYLLSLSEHQADDVEGRLSMWRAYGGEANVCLLLRTAAFTGDQDAYEVDMVAVDYRGVTGFRERFLALISQVEANAGRIANIDRNDIATNWKRALDDIVLSTKHPSFEEEQEWRIIHRREVFAESNVPSKVVNVGGTVQVVHYLPMENIPKLGVKNASLDEILERVIIGPTSNPSLVQEAFVRLLSDANVSSASDRVVMSGVPLKR